MTTRTPYARLAAARAAARAASGLSRALGAGSGSTIGGRVLLAVEPGALGRLGASRRIAVVTGTNGKTTTTHLLAAALRTEHAVTTNADGANMPAGLAWALASGGPASVAALEVDELYLPEVIRTLRPAVVLLLNLSRDQLDRNAEVHMVAARWRTAVTGAPGLTVVANADDPMVAWAAYAAPNTVWVSAGTRWHDDAVTCPDCGALLVVGTDETTGEPDWRCACGLRRPTPGYSVTPDSIRLPDGAVLPAPLALPGAVNVANAAFAVAGAGLLGVPADRAVGALRAVSEVAGRYCTTTYGGQPRRLLLAKNPAGWAEGLDMVPPDMPVVVAVNARTADGRDPSWLWDVPFERLRGRRVVAAGERAADVAVRLHYAEVDYETVDELPKALGWFAEPAVVMANYTAFQQIRVLIAEQSAGRRPGPVRSAVRRILS